MRLLTSLLIISNLLTPTSWASAVMPCRDGEATSLRIKSLKFDERISLTDSNNNVVGAINFESAKKRDPLELYLCGPNPGFFYITNTRTSDWIGEVGRTMTIGHIFSDEYEVDSSATTIAKTASSARVEIKVFVKFTADAEDADWAPFESVFYTDLPVN